MLLFTLSLIVFFLLVTLFSVSVFELHFPWCFGVGVCATWISFFFSSWNFKVSRFSRMSNLLTDVCHWVQHMSSNNQWSRQSSVLWRAWTSRKIMETWMSPWKLTNVYTNHLENNLLWNNRRPESPGISGVYPTVYSWDRLTLAWKTWILSVVAFSRFWQCPEWAVSSSCLQRCHGNTQSSLDHCVLAKTSKQDDFQFSVFPSKQTHHKMKNLLSVSDTVAQSVLKSYGRIVGRAVIPSAVQLCSQSYSQPFSPSPVSWHISSSPSVLADRML